MRAENGLVITDSLVVVSLQLEEFLINGGEVDFATLVDYVDSVMCDTLAGIEAWELPLHRYPLHFRLYRSDYRKRVINEFWKRNVDDMVTVDSSDILQIYNDSIHLFSVPEQVLLYHILISPDGFLADKDSAYYSTFSRDELQQIAEERVWTLWRILNFGEAFQNVAYDYSHDWMTRLRGGMTGWTVRNTYLDPFDTIAFHLEVGKHSRPYKDSLGWHLIMIEARYEAGPLSLDTPRVYNLARNTTRQALMNRRGDSIMSGLMQKMTTVVNPRILDTNIYYVDDYAWCAIINGTDTIEAWQLKEEEENYRRIYAVANTNADMKRKLINDIGRNYIVVQEARRTGIDTLPLIRRANDYQRWRHSRRVITSQAYDPGFLPSESQITAFYKEHLDRYNPRRPFTFELLTINDSSFGDFCWEQLQTGFEMRDLINEYHGKDGHILTLQRFDTAGNEELDPITVQAALGTARGKYSRPFSTPSGRHILLLIDVKESLPPPLARPSIVIELQKEHRDQVWRKYRDRLFQKYKVRRLARPAGAFRLDAFQERLNRSLADTARTD